MSWKIEKKMLNGLDTHVIISSNGAMRHASSEEVDMWNDILKLQKEKQELLDFINKTALKAAEIIKAKTGHSPKEAAPVAATSVKVEEKKKDEKKPEEKKEEAKPTTSVSSTPSGFGKATTSPEMARRFKKKMGRWPEGYTPTDEDKKAA